MYEKSSLHYVAKKYKTGILNVKCKLKKKCIFRPINPLNIKLCFNKQAFVSNAELSHVCKLSEILIYKDEIS